MGVVTTKPSDQSVEWLGGEAGGEVVGDSVGGHHLLSAQSLSCLGVCTCRLGNECNFRVTRIVVTCVTILCHNFEKMAVIGPSSRAATELKSVAFVKPGPQ